jgi:hypothetical protein
MSRVPSPQDFKTADGKRITANPFAGRARPVIRYAIIKPIHNIKLGEAVRCDEHPRRFAAILPGGSRADILDVTPGPDGCVPLGDAARALWTAHLDREAPAP